MKRKSIQHAWEIPLKEQIKLAEVIASSQFKFGGWEKVDGIFLSMGLDEQNEFYFQTANSPECRTYMEYSGWAKSKDPACEQTLFFRELMRFVVNLQNNTDFMRYLHVEKAKKYPLSKTVMNFEWFSKNMAEVVDGKNKYIRVLYPPIDFEKLTLLTDGYDVPENNYFMKVKTGLLVEKPSWQDVYFSDVAYRHVRDLLDEKPHIVSSSPKYTVDRTRLREMLKFFFTEAKFLFPIEGIVFNMFGRTIKVQNTELKKLPLNSKIFPRG